MEMISDQNVRRVALFFFYALVNERAATLASARVVAALKTKLGRAAVDEEEREDRIILMQSCLAHLRKIKKHVSLKSAPESARVNGAWYPSEGTDLSHWQRFRKSATDEELIALIFSRIWKCPDDEIAEALAITEGTVRYRIGKGVRRLGSTLREAV
jgi:DNA-directed RNA polymerase specialized sigma24 family protein